MFLSWGPPHHPYRTVPRRYLDLYDRDAIVGRPNCPEPPVDDLHGYYAQITFLDEQLGRLLDAVAECGLADDTIVVFTSDHGDMHGSHGVYKKQWPWDESILVPFVLRYPRGVKPGSRFDFPISVIDVMPTLLGLAGVAVPDTVEGVDLAPFIRGNLVDRPEHAALQARLEQLMRDLMARCGDEFLPKEAYYERFGLDVDERGKIKGIVDNPYDREG